MMFWYGHGVSGWGWFAMSLGMVVFWALVIGAGVFVFRALGRYNPSGGGEPGRTSDRPSPEQLLAERFAHGEIDADEYHARLAALHRGPASPSHTPGS